jgi:predicted enzyme related to lactoylglutathione lyase
MKHPFNWFECNGRTDSTPEFYAKALGWEVKTEDMGPEMGSFPLFSVPGAESAFAHFFNLNGQEGMENVPPHWALYVGVENVDEAVAKIEEHGGKLMTPAMDLPVGRMAMVADPDGATFWVYTPPAMPAE